VQTQPRRGWFPAVPGRYAGHGTENWRALPALFHNLRDQVSSCWLGGGEGRWEDHLAWSGGGTQLPLRPRPLRPMPTHRPPASPRLHLLHLLAGCRRSRLQD